MTVQPCPDRDTLQRLLEGSLCGRQAEQLETHLLQCDRCLANARAVSAQDGLTAAIRSGRQFPGDDDIMEAVVERARRLLSQAETVETDQTVPIATIAVDGDGARSSTDRSGAPVEIDFLAPPEQPDEIGRLGGYRILEVLGAGGMGIVFRAEDPRLKRQIALKAMKPAMAASGSSKDRFLREAQATAAIEHDNIVHIYQVGEDRKVPFIAMQFLRGESLRTRLERERTLDQRELLRIGREVAAGLEAAHERGLVHRDIKPDNIWLEAGGDRVKILDFGLVRAATDDAGLTQSGIVLGTPRYMAPEQAQGEPVDHRCDLFSLGSVLYHVAAGRAPFSGGSLTATLIAVAQADCRPIEELCPDLCPDVAALIDRLLAKDRNRRPQSAAAVAKALQAIEQKLNRQLPGHDEQAAPSPAAETQAWRKPAACQSGGRRRPRSPRPMFFAGGIIAVGLAVLAWLSFAGTIFKFETEDGTLVVKVRSDDFATSARGKQVTIKNTKTGETFSVDLKATEESKSLAPGSYVVLETDSGLKTETSHFTIHSGRKQVVEVTWEPHKEDVAQTAGPSLRNLSRPAEFVRGNWKIEGDVIEQRDNDRMAMILFGSPEFGDGDFTCEVLRAEGDGGLSIVARATDPENYYYFAAGAFENQWSSIYAKEAGVNWRRVAQTQTPPVPNNRWVKMRLRLRGDVFEGFVDDELVLRGKDDRRLKGYIGLRTWNETGRFRHPRFTDPAGKVLWEGLPTLPAEDARLDPDVHSFVDANRRAAEYVLSVGGTVKTDDNPLWTKTLPVEPFRLTGVNLEHQPRVTDAGLALLADCQDLKSLNLRWTGTTDAGLSHFQNCSKLTDLALGGGPGVTDRGLAYFQGCRALTYLYLCGGDIGDAGVANFKDCRDLSVLMLQFTHVSEAGLAPFGKCRNLHTLDLDWTSVTPAALAHFKDCRNLNKLVLGPGTTDECLASFENCRALTNIDLQGPDITDAGMAHFKNCGKLISLKLHNTSVTGAGLAQLENCGKLARIILSWSSLSDEDLAVFKNWKQLAELRLVRTRHTDGGIARLKDCRNLERLEISETPRVSRAMIAELRKALPNCDLRWDGESRGPDSAADSLRDALRWVLAGRGPQHRSYLTLGLEGRIVHLSTGDAPPDGPFEIKQLSLSGIAENESAAAIAHLTSLPAVPDLRLHNCDGIDDQILVALAGHPSYKDTRYLWLNTTGVTAAGLAHVAAFSKLEALGLGQSPVSARELASFRGLPISHLVLSLCKNVDDEAIAEAAGFSKLERLELAELPLTDAALEHLAKCKTLKSLVIERMKFSQAALDKLTAARPDLHVELKPVVK